MLLVELDSIPAPLADEKNPPLPLLERPSTPSPELALPTTPDPLSVASPWTPTPLGVAQNALARPRTALGPEDAGAGPAERPRETRRARLDSEPARSLVRRQQGSSS